MVGCNLDVLEAIDRLDRDIHVHVIEEPQLWQALQLEKRCLATASFHSFIPAAYQQSDDFLGVVEALPTVDCVLPGREYAVEPAARVAAALGLLGAGERAAASMRDKLRLREVTTGAGMKAPAYREVDGPAAIEEFMRREGPCVLKPANRHANLGVVILSEPGHVEDAWRLATAADEGAHLARPDTAWHYMVERRLVGPEYSTECLVQDGQITFVNVTRKRVSPGPYPLELGHDVPGVSPEELERFAAAARQLVEATGFSTGVVHAEWVDDAEGLLLVEAAGRLPSGRITELIDLAFGFSLEGALLDVLSGRDVDLPAGPRQAASVGFITVGHEGTVSAIDGVDRVRTHPDAVTVKMLVEPGDEVRFSRSSWDRVGFVTAAAGTVQHARRVVEELSDHIHIRVAQ